MIPSAHPSWLLAIAACGGLLIHSCRRDPGANLRYTVRATDLATARVDVELVLTGGGGDPVVLKAYEPDEYLRLGGLTATAYIGGSSRDVAVSTDSVSVERGRKPVTLTRRRLDATTGADSVVVAYSVRPGVQMWLSGQGKAPRRVGGYLGPDFGLLPGRNLFLVPESPFESVSVAVTAPEGWQVAAPWVARSPYRPRLFERSREEDLVNAVVGLGRFDHRRSEVDGNPLHLYLYSGWSQGQRDSLAATTARLYAAVNDLFGARDTSPYTVILTPKAAGSLDIAASASGAGTGMEMEPAVPVRWILLAAQMADRYLRHQPHGLRFYREQDLWFPEGVAFYGAMEAAVEAGVLPDVETYLRDVYLTYSESVLNVHEQIPFRVVEWRKLAAPNLTELRRTLGVVLAHQLDLRIAEATGGPSTLRTALARLWRDGDIESLREQLEEAAGVDLAGFYAQFVDLDVPREVPYPGESTFAEVARRVRPTPASAQVGGGTADTLTLVVTAGAESYLETCGCVASQSGGVARRAMALERIRQQRPHVGVVDVGDFLPDPLDVAAMDELTAREVETYAAAMDAMGYDLAAIGGHEVYHGAGMLTRATRGTHFALVGAATDPTGHRLAPPTYVLEVGGHRLALAAVYRPRQRLQRDGLTDRLEGTRFGEAVEAARAAVALRERGEADLAGVIGRLRLPDLLTLLERVPNLDLVLTSGSRSGSNRVVDGRVQQTQGMVEGFLGSTLVVSTRSGKYGIQQVDLHLDGKGRISGFHDLSVDLNEWVPDEPRVRGQLERFYRQVAAEAALHEGQVEPLFARDEVFEERTFVGSGACGECHQEQVSQWHSTRHARAYKTLLDAHRHYHPKCVLCHVAGLGREGGYRVGDGETDKAGVGCEVCHGPGSTHLEEPATGTIRRIPEVGTCVECHHGEHDDNFDYQRKVTLVSH